MTVFEILFYAMLQGRSCVGARTVSCHPLFYTYMWNDKNTPSIYYNISIIIYHLQFNPLSLNFGDDRRSGEPTPPKCNYDTGDWPDCPLSLSSAATAPLSDICPATGIPFPVIDCVKSLAYTFLSFMSQLL